MKKAILIAIGLSLSIINIARLGLKNKETPTIIVDKIVTGRYRPNYYFLLKDNKGEIIEVKVEFEDYVKFGIGDKYHYSVPVIYVKE